MTVLTLPLPLVTAKSPITTMANQLPTSNTCKYQLPSYNSTASSVILISNVSREKNTATRDSNCSSILTHSRNNQHFSIHISFINSSWNEACQIFQHDILADFINMIDFHAIGKANVPTLRKTTTVAENLVCMLSASNKNTQFIKHNLFKQTVCFYRFPDCTLKHYSFQTGWKRERCVRSNKFMGTISRMCAGIKRKYVTTDFKVNDKSANTQNCFCFSEDSFIKLCRQCPSKSCLPFFIVFRLLMNGRMVIVSLYALSAL